MKQVPEINYLMELDPYHTYQQGNITCPQWPTFACSCSMQEDPFDFYEEAKGG